MAKITNKQIRKHFGHNGCECIVRITRDGKVLRYGSDNTVDRSRDYWSVLGDKEKVIQDILRAA